MKISLPVLLLLGYNYLSKDPALVQAITEDENNVVMRDANASKERPRLEGYDLDDD